MSKLAALLGGMTLNDLAKEVLASQGRRGDTQLAHINRREAAILKDMGGSGSINPNTGMEEYFIDYPDMGGVDYGESYGNVTGAPMDYSYMNLPAASGGDVESQFGGFYGPSMDVGQPTPQVGGGQVAPTPQDFSGFDIGFGPGQFTPEVPAGGTAGMRAEDFDRFVGAPAAAPAPGIGQRVQGALRGAEQLAKEYPTLTRVGTAAALGIPGQVAARRARGDIERIRQERERMTAPIRAQGEAQLAAGQRGELTAAQQQQVAALQAAQAQARARTGVTSGTAAEQDRIRTAEFVQRLAQNNIDNGIRLIEASNTASERAIRDAYQQNADVSRMTQAYYAQLMRAAGALPTETTTTVTRTA